MVYRLKFLWKKKMNAFGVEQISKTIADICTRKMELNRNEGKKSLLARR